MPSVKVYNIKGEAVSQVELPDSHFGVKPSTSLIHSVVMAQEANKRTTKASTKTRGEVAGGGRKPWKQKGTGRARQGSIRSPQWVGGGITFGPRKERNYSVKINRKAKRAALFMVLSDRVSHDKLVIVDKFPIEEPKTKVFAGWIKKLPFGRKSLVVIPSSNPTLLRMVRNLPNIQLVTVNTLHLADLVKYPTVVFEQPSLAAFEALYNKA
ncbi:MAG: 50S ribosomal protein L4 [Patescibacteria group bacterium]|jgi:large subunit ribosomal protein L4